MVEGRSIKRKEYGGFRKKLIYELGAVEFFIGYMKIAIYKLKVKNFLLSTHIMICDLIFY